MRLPLRITSRLIPPSQTHPILIASPSAKGRAHEASCSVGRGAVSVLPFRKRRGGARNPVNGGGDLSVRLSPENGAALKAGRGQPPVGPVLETGHRHRGGRRRPMCQSCLCQPRRAGTHKSRGGRSVSATTGLPDAALIERPPPLMFQDMRTLFGNFIARHERRAGTGSRGRARARSAGRRKATGSQARTTPRHGGGEGRRARRLSASRQKRGYMTDL